MNLLAGSTGFLGNLILKELGLNKSPIIALGRRAISNLPDSAQELIIDFENISALKIPKLETVYLSLGYPLYYQNVLGVMSRTLKENFFKVDFTYQLQIAEKAKEKALFRTQRKAVEAGAHGTLDYTIKEGVNKNKIADEKILKSKK